MNFMLLFAMYFNQLLDVYITWYKYTNSLSCFGFIIIENIDTENILLKVLLHSGLYELAYHMITTEQYHE